MHWVTVTEEQYSRLTENADELEQIWKIIIESSTSIILEKNFRMKIIFDLFFYALRFSVLSKSSYQSLAILFGLIQDELEYTSSSKESIVSIFSSSYDKIVLERYREKVSLLLQLYILQRINYFYYNLDESIC